MIPAWPDDPIPELARAAAVRPVVVLDDDPTGTQTVSDVPVLTAWDSAAIAWALAEPVVFLSTNSRSLDEAGATRVTAEATASAVRAAEGRGLSVSFISRGDSTLRGHFPAEPMAIARAAGLDRPRFLLAPYFGDGGRVTVDDVHRLVSGGRSVPVGETEFARDVTFGYRSSNLRDWVAERYIAAGLPVPAIISIGLDLVRSGGPIAVAEALATAPPAGVAVVNAQVERDIQVVALGALLAEQSGVQLVARTAASYVRARAGRRPAPLLDPREVTEAGPGLVVIGSHVDTTSRQLRHLLEHTTGLVVHELSVEPLVAGGRGASGLVREAISTLDGALAAGRTGLVLTDRVRRDIGLEGGRAVSAALVDIVGSLAHRPAWVIGKGGITSSELASRALGMARARVLGQLIPGVPVWQGEQDARWPGVSLVVFPGNVGEDDALTRVVALLGGPAS